ncbi:ROK family protein [Clostridiaceae bacterium UIB06]|uniref:ROK family protein n=1 Tax=Clostridium thailandense TaxID=2794346 RepID=A0A949TSH2_9CLOT|nr:ROK family protein [Clostridium thailandense]MBV7272531.1 ROK family protein [Clostridium thailandense]MCH5138067.1 ROK family protein [Clostridiaceae bacterium UIB06]
MEKQYVIGVDLGGTKISTALAELNGNILSENTIPTNAKYGEEAVLSRIIYAIERILEVTGKKVDEIKAIGIGSPGPLDSKKGVIIETPNIPFKNFQLVRPIEDRFEIPTYLENDANAAAIGEFMFGAGKNTRNMVYITVSTGIGAGAIVEGRIYRGNTCNALELGHSTILPDGPRCNCGNYGCLEVLSSGTAIARVANEHLKAGADSSLKNYEVVTSYEVFQEAKKGDKLSLDVLNKCLQYLGIGIANIITIMDPEVVVLGGGVSLAGDIVFDRVNKVVGERCFKVLRENCRVVPAALGKQSGVVGSVALAIMESLEDK